MPRGAGQAAQGLSAAAAAFGLGCLGRCPRPVLLARPSPARCWGPAGQAPLSLLCVFQVLACPDISGWGDRILRLVPRYLQSDCRVMRRLVLRCLIVLCKQQWKMVCETLTVSRGQLAEAMLAAWGWVRGAG